MPTGPPAADQLGAGGGWLHGRDAQCMMLVVVCRHGNGAFENIARIIRGWTVNKRQNPARPVIPMQQVVSEDDPDET